MLRQSSVVKEPRLAPVYQRKENDRLGTIRPAPSPDRRASVAMAHKRPSTIDKNKIISTSDCLSGSCRRWFHAHDRAWFRVEKQFPTIRFSLTIAYTALGKRER
jgi:hypothetical protein